MLRQRIRRLILVLASLFVAKHSFADDCSFLKRDPLELRDRQLFFRSQGTNDWTPLDGFQADLSAQKVEFAYVIREKTDPARSGVVILKSARKRQFDEPAAAQKVHLVRHAERFDNGSCGVVADFGEKEVPSESYDRYHDEGRKVREREILHAFHFRYAARKGTCRQTDDGTQDSLVPWDPRSNRAQFSFDPAVVSGGTYSQALAWIGVSKTYASSGNLAEQRVELRQYRVDASFPTCVRFTLSTPGRNSFLRINDLEAVTPNGLNYSRSSENQWSLAP